MRTAKPNEISPAEIEARDKRRGYTDVDLAEVGDNPEWTDEELRDAKPFAEVFPAAAATIKRVRVKQKAPTKELVTLRLEKPVLEHFKKGGRGWQVRMGDALKKAAGL